MKRLYLILIIAASLFNAKLDAQAESKQSGAERVQALRIAYITERLNLTPDEAQVFWPLYNEYNDKRDALRKQSQENRRKIKDQIDQLSDDELQRLADDEIRIRQEDLALQVELHEKLKKVISAKKLALLYVAEDEFKKRLVKLVTDENKDEDSKSTKTGKGNK